MGPWDPAPSEPETPGPEPRRRGPRVWMRLLGIVGLIALVAFLAVYVFNAKFTLREVSYSDDTVDVEIIEPLPSRASRSRPKAPAPAAPSPQPEP